MLDRRWHTLKEVAMAAQCSETGASARIRDLRKLPYGQHVILSAPTDLGVWLYRLVI